MESPKSKIFPEDVLLYYDPVYLEHITLPHHPEQPNRLTAIVNHFKKSGLWNMVKHRAPDNNRINDELISEYIGQVHPIQHVEYIKRKSEEAQRAQAIITPFSDGGDTNVSGKTYRVGRKAVAAAIEATDAVCKGETHRAFCAIRPPGHHCERNRPMGFCVFNNIAIAARFAQRTYEIERVAIVDWDVHHGNGTQAIFYNDPSVLYISLHQYPHYPGTGSANERGAGDADGTTINFPLAAGTGEKKYEDIFMNKIVPALEKFKPGLLFISAGFDAHRDDPLGDMLLTDASFALFTRILSDASTIFDGKIVSLLEGGYNLNGLVHSVASHIQALGGVELVAQTEIKGDAQ